MIHLAMTSRRPKTYNRKFNSASESRRAVGTYYDPKDCKIKTCRFSVSTGDEGAKRLELIRYLYENGGKTLSGYWTPGMLELAKKIAAGEPPTFWAKSDDPVEYARKVISSQQLMPGLKIATPDMELMIQSAEANKEFVDEKIANLAKELNADFALQAAGLKMPTKLSTEGLHQKVSAYRKDRVANYKGGYQGSVRVGKQINAFKSLLDDCKLYEFDFTKIKKVVDHYCNRPLNKRGTVTAKSYCENQITEFYRFCRWLENTADWVCPKLASIDRRVRRTLNDAKNNEIRDDRYWEPNELIKIYANAQPLTKLLIGLGLNTGSGPAELGRMRLEHFVFDKPHPYAKTINCQLVGSWFIGHRIKGYTHSEAYLWSWVADLVKAQVSHCKELGWKFLFTENGEPLYLDNDIYKELGLNLPSTEKPESRFITRYENAIEYATKQGQVSRSLSIGKLRKTLSNYLAREAHEDLAQLLLSHKTKDDLLKHYANRPYGRLHKSIFESESHWRLPK
jgi:integrase